MEKSTDEIVSWHPVSETRPAETFVLAELANGYRILEPCDPMPAHALRWAVLNTPIEADGLVSCVDD